MGHSTALSVAARRMAKSTLHRVGEEKGIARASLHYTGEISHLLKGCALLIVLVDDLKKAGVPNECHYYCNNNIASGTVLLVMLSAPVIFKPLLECHWSALVLGNKETELSLFYTSDNPP